MRVKNNNIRRGLVFSEEKERQAMGSHSTAGAFSSDDESSSSSEASSPPCPVNPVAEADRSPDADETEVRAPSANSAVVVDPVAAGADEYKKRKREDDEANAEPLGVDAKDEDVEPLRLRKVYRSKAQVSAVAKIGENDAKPTPAAMSIRNEASPSFASPSSMLSPMKDATKRRVTPRKARISRKPQNLQSRLGATELSEKQVVKLIEKLYKEQEEDDRDMYNILTETVKEQTQCERSDVVEELSQMEFRRMLTYGEVSVESVSSTILPFLKLQADDVFYDLGCGSGKIVIQVALQTPCKVAKGIELMLNRVEIGANALGRLIDKKLPVIEGKHIDIVQGDICKPPERANMMDATVVFINNVCFGPELMLQVTSMLSLMPNLRRVVTLRKFCERHRPQKCMRAGNLCVEYVHPPEEAEIFVSWASKTSVYLYERVEFCVGQFADQLIFPSSQSSSQDSA